MEWIIWICSILKFILSWILCFWSIWGVTIRCLPGRRYISVRMEYSKEAAEEFRAFTDHYLRYVQSLESGRGFGGFDSCSG